MILTLLQDIKFLRWVLELKIKEHTMKLKPDYTECHMHIPDTPAYRGGPFLVILTPDGHVWRRSGAEQKHPECFEPEQLDQSKLHRGDWLKWKVGSNFYKYVRFLNPGGKNIAIVEDGGSGTWAVPIEYLTLMQCCLQKKV